MSIYVGNTKIGQMYLGSTEIAEAYLGSTKVHKAYGGGDLTDYVQDGLIFHLDGIQKGGSTGYWIDLIGNIDFILDSGVVEGDDSITGSVTNDQCARNESYGSDQSTISTYTIECAFKEDNSWATNFQPFIPVSGICLGFSTNGSRFYIGARSETSGQWSAYTRNSSATYNTISANTSRAMQNGASLTQNNTMYAGKQSSCRAGRLNGKTFSVRIYNRQLSADEMLQNQRVDNIRFNLGLTI